MHVYCDSAEEAVKEERSGGIHQETQLLALVNGWAYFIVALLVWKTPLKYLAMHSHKVMVRGGKEHLFNDVKFRDPFNVYVVTKALRTAPVVATAPTPSAVDSIALTQSSGIARVLESWVEEGDRIAEGNARAQTKLGRGERIDGDDIVHPLYGRYVGAAKWMREHPNARVPMIE